MAFFSPYDESEYATLEDIDFPPVEYELPEEWKGLRQEMDQLQQEYTQCRREIFAMTQQVRQKYENIERLRNNVDVFGAELKESYQELLDRYELECRIDEDVLTVRKLIGKRDAMKKFLKLGKDDDRLCPVCCDAPVACFLYPCGHTFCRPCISRHSESCPVCRTKTKQVFPLFFN